MGEQHKFYFSSWLQRSVLLLRNCGLLYENQYPVLLSPISIIMPKEKMPGMLKAKYQVRLRIRESFTPNEIWLKGDRRSQGTYISFDQKEWICINQFRWLYKHIK